ncbi:predicted protein [Nematostella vectensis]|uniref:thiopurine S-methyltransferase n=1 Tax=Nematostella vectensis TaxID=45351 RepID=A7RKP1_NEMVE|nr:probable thiopurine S-methyltransferase [Nematostella vectensis]EDO47942.1 predicted protein [Nematostella vectensis]|eukprot:XP_001640005.1 predicted protein [Nematostella vectensis]
MTSQESIPKHVADVDYWISRWENNETSWHKDAIQPCLLQHFDKLIPNKKGSPKPRVLLPLCGKSLDLLWLADQGCQVVGVEGASKPIEEFYQENNLPFDTQTVLDPNTEAKVKCYYGRDRDIKIYQVDLFAISASLIGEFDAIWDRGSLSAIGLYIDNRGSRYANLLVSLLKPHGRYMIENHHYIEDPGPHRGPPSDVPEKVLRELYGEMCEIENLEVDLPAAPSQDNPRPFVTAYYVMHRK